MVSSRLAVVMMSPFQLVLPHLSGLLPEEVRRGRMLSARTVGLGFPYVTELVHEPNPHQVTENGGEKGDGFYQALAEGPRGHQ